MFHLGKSSLFIGVGTGAYSHIKKDKKKGVHAFSDTANCSLLRGLTSKI